MPGRTEFTLDLGPSAGASGMPGAPAKRRDGSPMRLLLLGDFSGQTAGERPPLASRPTHRVDLDTLDAVMARLAPRLTLAGGSLDFGALDDFHPDALLQRFAPLHALRQARSQQPAAAADLLGSLLGNSSGAAAAAPSQKAPPAKAPPAAGIDAFIHSIVAPHIVADTRLETEHVLAAVDAATAEQMRTVLHDPAFQALESSWRGVQWLVSSLELDDALQLHLFDLRPDEMAADIVAARGNLAGSGLYAALVDRTRGQPGAQPWAALVALQQFGASDTDIALLAALGVLASEAGAPVLVAASPAWLGWRSFAEASSADAAPVAGWTQLRGSEVSPWMAAAGPRMLLRLPYGKKLDPVDSFAFEEFSGPAPHDALLWAPGSLALACTLAHAFSSDGWAGDPAAHRQVDGLPAYTFSQDGEPVLQACAEFYLGEAAMQSLAACGLVGLASHRHLAVVQAQRLQSVASPATTLAGPWT